ncbi:MAG: hypothetical protein M1457_08220 [bacterium]|nr:hypothetical protein [bacterium]
MTSFTRFRVQAGGLVFEIEGAEAFVREQMKIHHEPIDTILREQSRLIREGKMPPAVEFETQRRRGARLGRNGGQRRPGRQPAIVRESQLKLTQRQLASLKKYLAAVTAPGPLGKDGAVFALAYHLTMDVLKENRFTAGDISVTFEQVGAFPRLPPCESIDVVQMLRNLAASSIGKEWVVRNYDGTFSITDKGRAVGETGQIVRPRGRRPARLSGSSKAASFAQSVSALASPPVDSAKVQAPRGVPRAK